MRILPLVATSLAVGATAAPAAAQQPYSAPGYPYPYAQPAPPPYPGQLDRNDDHATIQPYGPTGPMNEVVNRLLGGSKNYSDADRAAVTHCAVAALAQAERTYRPLTGSAPPHAQPFERADEVGFAPMRVTAITSVKRQSRHGLSVIGLISSGDYPPVRQNRDYLGQIQPRTMPRHSPVADISFRCEVDYDGTISSLRLNRTAAARPPQPALSRYRTSTSWPSNSTRPSSTAKPSSSRALTPTLP